MIPMLSAPPAGRCGDPGSPIPYACAFDGAQRLTRTASGSGVGTYSLWLRRTTLGTAQTLIRFGGSAALKVDASDRLVVAGSGTATTTAVYRDPTSWLHIVIRVLDSAGAFDLWVNGQSVLTGTDASLPTAPPQEIGALSGAAFATCAVAEVVGCVGVIAAAEAFGRQNRVGVWVPRRYTGSYGAQGWHLDFADAANPGRDVSGNGNHWTASGLTAAAQETDTPADTALRWSAALTSPASPLTLTGGGAGASQSVTGGYYPIGGSLPIPARGRWIIRGRYTGPAAYISNITVGLIPVGRGLPSTAVAMTQQADVIGYGGTGYVVCGSTTPAFTAPALTLDDHWLIAVDSDRALIWLGYERAGLTTWWDATGGATGNPATGANPTYTDTLARRWILATSLYAYGCGNLLEAGGAVPDGYRWLTASALPCPPIPQPGKFMAVRRRSGGAGVADLPWDPTKIKTAILSKRTDATADWRLVVSDQPGRAVAVNLTTADFSEPTGLTLTASGYTIGAAAAYQGTRQDLIWRASTAAGFDLLTVTHTTGTATAAPHAAGGVIDYAWVIGRGTGMRRAYHRSLTAGQSLSLTGSAAAGTDSGWFTPTATGLTLGASLPSDTYTLLVWRAVPQFSAFGIYTGTGAADGPMIPLDFAPAVVISKQPVTSAETIVTALSGLSNPVQAWQATDRDTAFADTSAMAVDGLAAGLKIRGTGANRNSSGQTYTYAAWADCPAKFGRAR